VTAKDSVRWCVDGREGARIPADDRGLAYGDGLFETIAVLDGAPRLLEHHLDRLTEGARRLAIPARRGELRTLLRQEAASLGCGVLKLLLSRGSGPRGYAPPAAPTPRLITGATPRGGEFAALSDEPIRVRTCHTPASINPALAGLKHLNRLDQVMARSEWNDPAVSEGLMYDADDNLVCATAANVFLLTESGRLVTPAVDRAGVAGVMRRAVLEVAGTLTLPVEVRAVGRAEVLRAREVMLSSSLLGLRCVGMLDGRALAPGALGRRLRSALARRFEAGR
jgi:4-amino-4-deoxychorismate lyase